MGESTAQQEYARQMDQWRTYLAKRSGITDDDAAELEDHLASQVDDLTGRGLAQDEAFMVAIKRLGAQSDLAADFARENTQELWKQFVVEGAPGPSQPHRWRGGVWPMLGFATIAGALMVVAVQLGTRYYSSFGERTWIVLPLTMLAIVAVLAAYLRWSAGRFDRSVLVPVAAAILLMGCAALFYPFAQPDSLSPADTRTLFLIHLPIACLVLLGVPYLGADWRNARRWMDYIRFVGEWVIYYALIALGGGVLVALTMGIFFAFGIDAQLAMTEWVVPAGIGGALVVTAWLVQLKRSVVENMAPVLTMVFTPLFTLVLLALLATVTVTGSALGQDRNLLILIDLLLVVVWGLVLFAASARPESNRPRMFDWLQVALIATTLVVDVLVLVGIASRIGEWGSTPNRMAALGENLVLAVNLAWSLWLYIGFLHRRRTFEALVVWQSRYLPVVGIWAAIVMFAFPPLFNFR